MNWYQEKRDIISRFLSRLSKPDREEWLHHRALHKKSLFFFIKELAQYTIKAGGDISPLLHKPICDFWQDNSIKRKVVYMPRAWRKTTCMTQWACLWDYLQNNEVRILIATEKEEKATEWVSWIESQVLRHERLRWQYPELTVVTDTYTRRNPWSGKRCRLPRAGIYPEATIQVIGIRGGAQGGHYEIVSMDDLMGEKGMESPSVRLDAQRWFDNVEGLLTNKDASSPTGSIVRLVGTFWAPGDIGCYIMGEYPAYQWRITPCLKDGTVEDRPNVKWIQHPEVEVGESNWPEVYPTQIYREMEASPGQQITFWTQYMNQPGRAGGLTKFNPEWIRYYEIEIRGGHKHIVCDDGMVFPLSSIPLYGFFDPGGFSEKKPGKERSRNAIVVGGQPTGSSRKFILHAWAEVLKEPERLWEQFVLADEATRPLFWRIEIFAQQRYILKDFQERAKNLKRAIRIMPMEADARPNAKDLNIQALIVPASKGEIFIHKSMKDLIAEFTSYPHGLTKDLLDMVAKMNQLCWRDINDDVVLMNAKNLEPEKPAPSGIVIGY